MFLNKYNFRLRKRHQPYFIIASPRSGTTWMSKMLNAHSQVFCVERRLFGNYADFVKDEGQSSLRLRVTLDKYINSMMLHHGLPNKNKENLMRSILSNIIKEEKKYSKKNIIVDKITPYLNSSNIVIKQINRFFPKSKIIYIVRDGRDVLTSGVFHWFNKKQSNTELNDFELERRQMYLKNENPKMERFFQDKEIHQWAKEWMQPLETIKIAQKTHSVLIINYEDLLENTEQVLVKCLKFIGAKIAKKELDECIEEGRFSAMSKGREQGEVKYNAHVRKGISGDWKNYFTYQDAKLFQKIVGSTLIDFGYEKSENWCEELR